jgi:hypothetical protein
MRDIVSERPSHNGLKPSVKRQLHRSLRRFANEIQIPTTGAGKLTLGILFLVAAMLAILRLRHMMLDPVLPGEDWRNLKGHYLVDYRDLIYGPGRFLRAGGNPYDPDGYLAATPGSVEFDPYAPVWLMLAVPLSTLPYLTGALIYEICTTILLAGFSALIVRIASLPRKRLCTVLLFSYLLLWYPSRTAAEHGSSLLATFGVVLALHYFRTKPWLSGVGVALALVKPQFGLPILVFLAVLRGWPPLWRGVLLLVASSLPMLGWCIANAGGIPQFVDALLRDVHRAGSADNPGTGLSSPFLLRVDLVGILSRITSRVPPEWVQVSVPLVVLAGTGLALRRGETRLLHTILILTATLMVVVHQPYDLVIIALPAIWTLAEFWRRRWKLPDLPTVVCGVAVIAVVVHLYAFDRLVFPGASVTSKFVVDGCLVAIAWSASVVASLRGSTWVDTAAIPTLPAAPADLASRRPVEGPQSSSPPVQARPPRSLD